MRLPSDARLVGSVAGGRTGASLPATAAGFVIGARQSRTAECRPGAKQAAGNPEPRSRASKPARSIDQQDVHKEMLRIGILTQANFASNRYTVNNTRNELGVPHLQPGEPHQRLEGGRHGANRGRAHAPIGFKRGVADAGEPVSPAGSEQSGRAEDGAAGRCRRVADGRRHPQRQRRRAHAVGQHACQRVHGAGALTPRRAFLLGAALACLAGTCRRIPGAVPGRALQEPTRDALSDVNVQVVTQRNSQIGERLMTFPLGDRDRFAVSNVLARFHCNQQGTRPGHARSEPQERRGILDTNRKLRRLGTWSQVDFQVTGAEVSSATADVSLAVANVDARVVRAPSSGRVAGVSAHNSGPSFQDAVDRNPG